DGGARAAPGADQRVEAPPGGARAQGLAARVRARAPLSHHQRVPPLTAQWLSSDFSPANGLTRRSFHGKSGQLPLSHGCCGSLASSTRRASAASWVLPSWV